MNQEVKYTMKENLLTVNDVCDELGIGKTTAYKLIKDKEIHSGKIGKKIIIRRSDLDDYIEKSLSADK